VAGDQTRGYILEDVCFLHFPLVWLEVSDELGHVWIDGDASLLHAGSFELVLFDVLHDDVVSHFFNVVVSLLQRRLQCAVERGQVLAELVYFIDLYLWIVSAT